MCVCTERRRSPTHCTVVLDLADENAGAIGLHFGAQDLGSFLVNVAVLDSYVKKALV